MVTKNASVTGNWTDSATWGGTGKPADNDIFVINSGVTVYYDEDMSNAGVWPNGMAGGVINGTLTVRTDVNPASYYLKSKANITMSATLGRLQAGTALSRLDPGIKWTINMQGYYINAGAGNTIPNLALYCDIPNILFVRLTQQETIGTATLHVDTDVSADPDWVNGYEVAVVEYGAREYEYDKTFVSATATTITLSAGLTAQKEVGAYIVLLRRNIRVIGTSYSFVSVGSLSEIALEMFTTNGISAMYGNSLEGCVMCVGASNVGMSGGYYPSLMKDTIFIGASYVINGGYGQVFEDCLMLANTYAIYQGCNNITLRRCTVTGNSCPVMYGQREFLAEDCIFQGNGSGFLGLPQGMTKNCLYADAIEVYSYTSLAYGTPGFLLESFDHDQVAGAYKAWCYGGIITNDSGVTTAGHSFSYKHACEKDTNWCFWERTHTVQSGKTIKFRAYVRKTVAMATTPKIGISLKEEDPLLTQNGYSYLAEQSMTNSVDTWERLDIEYTNATSLDQTVICRTMAMNASGYAYFCPEIVDYRESWG